MNTCELTELECPSCRGGMAPLDGDALNDFSERLGKHWDVVDNHHLERGFRFRNFGEALGFTNRIGELAEAEGHHPEITLTWGQVTVRIWTHKIDGLTESDFVLAAKIGALFGD